MKRSSALLAALLTLAMITNVKLSAPASAAPTPVQLGPGTTVNGISSFGRMLVGGGYVFVSDSVNGTSIAIMRQNGTQADTITNIPGPNGMAVSGSTLYVAAAKASAIYVYDVSSLPATKTATYSTLPVSAPTSLALSGGRLWFTGLDSGVSSQGTIGTLKPNGTDLQEYTPTNYEYWQYYGVCGDIDQSDFAPDRIFLHGNGCGEPDALYLYDTSAVPPVLLSNYGLSSWGSYSSQPVAVLPDGSGMVVQNNNTVVVESLDALTGPTFSYQVPSGWSVGWGISTAQPNLIATGGGISSAPAVILWDEGQVLPSNAFLLSKEQGGVASDGIAFRSNGTKLFVLSSVSGSSFFFHVIDPTMQGTALTLKASTSQVTYGHHVKFSVTLTGPPGGQTVHIDTVKSGTLTQVGSCTTGTDGTCAWSTVPKANAVYEATFAGVTGWAPSVSVKVGVDVAAKITAKLRGYYGTSSGYRLFHENKRVYYNVSVRPALEGRRVTISLLYNFGAGWQSGGHNDFKENAYGQVKIYFPSNYFPKGRYALVASYGGDPDHVGAETPRAYFRITS